MKKMFSLALVLGSFLGAAELLPDPGFLTAKSGAAPAGLKMPAAGGQISVETKDGKNVLKIDVEKKFYLRSVKYIPVKGGEKFTLSADVSGKGTVQLVVNCFSTEHRFCGNMSQAFKLDGRQEIKKEFTVPATFKGKNVGSCLFDVAFPAGSWELARFSVTDESAK
ncbi:MAG: hypothetical protein IJS01_02595 [Lentisphaeria bacterium]|nr:hypothetical protein [Lentisphaeria bacterium]